MKTAILWSAAVLSGTCWGEEPNVESTLDHYEKSLNAVRSFDVHLNIKVQRLLDRIPGDQSGPPQYQRVNPEESASDFQGRHFLSGEKFRLDCLENSSGTYEQGELVTVWDGSLLKIHDARRKQGRIWNNAKLTSLIVEGCPPYASLFKMCFGDYAYPEFIRDRRTIVEQRDGMIMVDALPAPTRAIHLNVYGARFLLDPSKGHMPVRIEWYVDARNVVKESTRIDNELAEVQPGVWLPIWSRLVFLIEEPSSAFYRDPYSTMDVAVDRERSSFNAPIDEGIFKFDFPMGTAVRDDRQ
jgi:hypothetical protein